MRDTSFQAWWDEQMQEAAENPPDFRANPPSNYWRWLWNRDSLSFGPFAPWVAWRRYQAMLDDFEAWRRRNYTPTIGAYWLTKTVRNKES